MPIHKNTNTTHIIIIGAGPAGISTALHLIQKDPSWADRMIILEKARHPRPKLCGGGLTRFGLRILRNLDVPLPLPLPQAEVQDVIFRYGEREIHVRGKPQFIVFQRPMLDAYLAEVAKSRGVHIQEDEPVTDIKVSVDSISVTTPKGSYQAKILIGADGSTGITRRLLKSSQGSRHVARLLETFIPATENADLFKSKQALFDFSFVNHDLQGYTWDFPSWVNGNPIFNRGIYDSRVIAQRPRASLPTLLSAFIKMDNQSDPFKGHPIHWFSPKNVFSSAHILLVGDAAGTDPLFGEGIGPALSYGATAAEAIQQAFSKNQFTFQNYRRQILFSPVGRYLLVRWVGAQVIYRFCTKPRFMNLLWRVGNFVSKIWQAGKL